MVKVKNSSRKFLSAADSSPVVSYAKIATREDDSLRVQQLTQDGLKDDWGRVSVRRLSANNGPFVGYARSPNIVQAMLIK